MNIHRFLEMQKIAVRRLVESIETSPIGISGFAVAFLAIILVRLLIESTIGGMRAESLSYLFFEFSHTFLFFLFAFILFLPVARMAGANSISRAANLLLFGFLIIWTPPIIDSIIFRGEFFWSFYELDGIRGLAYRFFHFFGSTPDIGITYGVRTEVALMTVGLGLYTFFRTRKFLRSVGIAIATYALFFVLGTFPSWITLPVVGYEKGILSVTELDVAGLMLSPEKIFETSTHDPRMSLGVKMSLVYAVLLIPAIGIFLFRSSRKIFMALLGNIRFPQAVWHGGLLFLGGGLAVIFGGVEPDFGFFEILAVIVMIIAVESAWIASVIGNDLVDQKIDMLTNGTRPLPTGTLPPKLYAEIGTLFFVTSLFFAAIVSFKVSLLLLSYQAIAWLYSMPPLRLKRFPIIATALAATAGIIVLLIGFSVLAPKAEISTIPLPILGFLFTAYAATLPLKDFKDIKGDATDGVHTIPVIFGEERARLIVGTALFLCYAASPVILHEILLTIPSILFGSLAFMSVMRAERENRSWGSFRSLPAWNMLFVTLYGIFVALILL